MKYSTVVIASLVACSASPAWSQGVTLAGVVDAAARHVSNEGRGSVSSLVSGSNSTSKIIVRGVESLGGGLSAGFHLEHGFQLDSGAQVSSTQFWDRRATVHLVDKEWGEIRMGRDYVPNYLNWNRFDPFAYVGAGGANNFISATPNGPIRSAFGSGLNTTVRSNDSLQYILPGGLGGLEGSVMLAAGEGGTTAEGKNKFMGGRLGYAGKGFNVSAAASRSTNNLTGGNAFRDQVVAASYDFGPVQLSAALRQFKQAAAKQTNMLLGAWIPVGSGTVKISMNRANLSGRVGAVAIDANDAQQLAVGYVYDFSKRSAVYTTLSVINNKGAATYAVPGGPSGMAGGGTSKGIEVGLRHNF